MYINEKNEIFLIFVEGWKDMTMSKKNWERIITNLWSIKLMR